MTVSGDGALDLISDIYHAAIDPASWPETLCRVGQALGGVQECVIAHDPATQFAMVSAPRRDPCYVQRFRDEWMSTERKASGNPLAQRLPAAPLGQVLDLRELVPTEEFIRTDFYSEWWRPQGLGPVSLGVRLGAADGLSAFCGIHGAPGCEAFAEEKVRLFSLLAPHLLRTIQIQRRMWQLSIEAELTYSVPHQQGKALVLLDVSGRIVFANQSATEQFSTGGCLRIKNGFLETEKPATMAALKRLILTCADRRASDPGGPLLLASSNGSGTLHGHVTPFRLARRMNHTVWPDILDPVAVLILTDPEGQRKSRREALRRRFGLTPAEADFALEIIKGDGRKAAACRLGISLSTARTHLTHIFGKTSVSRQAELVALLSQKPS